MTSAERQQLLNRAAEAIQRAIPDVIAVYAYGSIARGDDHPDSDIDIGVLLTPGRKLDNVLTTLVSVQDEVGRNVDLVDLRRCGNVLRKEVLSGGILLYTTDKAATLAWEAEALSEYAAHRMEIRDILKQFAADGIGYAQ
jgi:predicted nucleotidyltransferase